MSNGPMPTTPLVNGNKLVLQSLTNKIKMGHNLTNIESGMGIISSNIVNGNKFGPDVTEMQVDGFILPERIQAAIINAAG